MGANSKTGNAAAIIQDQEKHKANIFSDGAGQVMVRDRDGIEYLEKILATLEEMKLLLETQIKGE